MAKLFLSILFLFLFASCSNTDKQYELDGHWHLFWSNSHKYGMYKVLNIKENTIIDFDGIDYLTLSKEIGFPKNGGNINTDSQFVLLYDGMYGLHNYRLNEDSIFLIKRLDVTFINEDFWGVKIPIEQCNLIEDLYSHDWIKPDLPMLLPSDSIVDLPKSYVIDVLAGRNKETQEFLIQFEPHTNSEDNLELAFAKFAVKFPENEQNDFTIRLSIDKHTAADTLRSLYNLIESSSFKTIVEQKLDKNGNVVSVKHLKKPFS